MLENLEIMQQLGVVLTAIAGIFTTIFVILYKTGVIFKKNDTMKQIDKLEQRLDEFKKEIRDEIDKETNHADDTHIRIFAKLEELSKGIAFIRGYLTKD